MILGVKGIITRHLSYYNFLYFIFHTSDIPHCSCFLDHTFSIIFIFHTLYFPLSSFSILTFYTLHSPPSSFSILHALIFCTCYLLYPSFPYSSSFSHSEIPVLLICHTTYSTYHFPMPTISILSILHVDVMLMMEMKMVNFKPGDYKCS